MLYDVPAGKRLVLEYVNMHGIGPSSPVETLLVTLRGTPQTSPSYVFVVENRGDTQIGSLLYTHSERVRVYFEGGETVSMCATRGSLSIGSMTVRAKLSGYLVDLP